MCQRVKALQYEQTVTANLAVTPTLQSYQR